MGAMRITLTAALETLLNLSLLHLVITEEARMAKIRLEKSLSYKGSDKLENSEYVRKQT